MNENETRKTNYAAIDIGSNAVRLLIKEIKEEQGNAHFSKVLMCNHSIFRLDTHVP